jgi:hypothetical protein
MTLDPQLRALEQDLEAVRDRIARQKRVDPDHEVALAMFYADYQRAANRLQEYTGRQFGTRRYVDGKLRETV